MRTVDLFCGCGGFTTGLRRAGFHVELGIDYDKDILGVYQNNHEHHACVHDLHDCEGAVRLIRKHSPECEVVAGSPPCIEFSRAGSQVEGAIASLTVAYARIVTSVKPKLFMMENVPDVLMSATFVQAKDILQGAGYSFCTILRDSKYCNVPQCRRRVFVVGARAGCETVLQKILRECGPKLPVVSVRQYLHADGINCPDFFYFAARNKHHPLVVSTDVPYPTLRSSNGVCLSQPPKNTSAAPRPNDAAALSEARVLTIAQAASIASFPNTYTWPESRKLAGIVIGNCVPPNMAYWLACIVLRHMRSYNSTACGLHVGTWVNPTKERTIRKKSHIATFMQAARELSVDMETAPVSVTPVKVNANAHRPESAAFRPSTQSSANELFYTMGTNTALDEIAQRVAGYPLKMGWTLHVRERVCQRSRIDDVFVHVPGQLVPYRGKRLLLKNGLLLQSDFEN